MKSLAFTLLILTSTIFYSCNSHQPGPGPGCDNSGILWDASDVGVPCDGPFIELDNGDLLQPVGGRDLLKGVKRGEHIHFGYEVMYLGMRSCASTVKMTCVVRM